MPDDYATIQAAIDIGADTVLVREGDYSEVPQAYRGVVLLGLGDRRPRLNGLAISNAFEGLSRNWSVTGIDFSGPITISTGNVHARFINIAIADCGLDAGIQHVASDDIYDINLLSIARSRLPVACYARVANLTLQADTVDAGQRWTVNGGLRVSGCWFRGGPGIALDVDGDILNGAITTCLFENYTEAARVPYIDSSEPDGFVIERNVIRRMSTWALGVGLYFATLKDNVVTDCSKGVLITERGRLNLYDNTILRCGEFGFWLDDPGAVLATGNVIGDCTGDAIALGFPTIADFTFKNNTFFRNTGSGIGVSVDASMINVVVENNIAAWNGEYGLSVHGNQVSVVLGCNDWFANGLGAVTGVPASDSDRAVDPGFCDVANDSVGLYSDSPLLGQSACGQIGARGVGCSPPTLSSMTVASIHAGLRVDWAFPTPPASGSWIERAEQLGGPWDSLGTGGSSAGNGFELLDAAVAPNREYHYRVAWRDRGAIVRGSPANGIWTEAGRLSSVTPSPAHGEATVEWVLSHAGMTEIRVFDLSGRQVATVARASYGVGRHQAQWDGRWEGRGAAPAGMYVVRISSADGTSTHRVLMLR